MTKSRRSITLGRRIALWGPAATLTVFAAVFVKLADAVRESDFVVRIDRNVLDFVVHHRVGWLSTCARLVTVLGSGWVVAAVVATSASVLALRHRLIDALFVAASATGTAITVTIVKHTVGRGRPALPDRLVRAAGAAFPSGHAAQSIACYGALAAIVVAASRSSRTRACVIAGAVVVALAVGASRIYLGVHWVSDVVGGWLVAAGWLLALIGIRAALETPTSTLKS